MSLMSETIYLAAVATMASRAASVPVTNGQDETVLTKAIPPGQAVALWALSVPLTLSDNERRNHSQLANFQHFMSVHWSIPRQTPQGYTLHLTLLGQSIIDITEPNPSQSYPRRTSLSPYLADESSIPLISGDSQQPSFHERPFPKGTGTGRTRWFCSSSAQQLLCPNEDIVGVVGDLYVHTNTRSRITYIWVLHPDEGWAPIEPGDDHPTVPKRRLRIHKW
ncbi:hypothetical protein DFJ58DRAFT_736920 [Suillus subalutaceus]|uniref:uncharacterized protein n=1 Tax=Suillus subalutaceus TaxID=48586 RepID=UPI001B87130B|nr:uncharacterized protein DFJ58DRAFT_736920 [Suillus subalutaceus]KAG1830671.1 hypothetical protein DFJ58DRAFT_736920 [Suillus subalutaceus]